MENENWIDTIIRKYKEKEYLEVCHMIEQYDSSAFFEDIQKQLDIDNPNPVDLATHTSNLLLVTGIQDIYILHLQTELEVSDERIRNSDDWSGAQGNN